LYDADGMVSEIATNRRKVDESFDAEMFEFRAIANTRIHKNLRSANGSRREDDVKLGCDLV